MEDKMNKAWEIARKLYPETLSILETITGFERGTGNVPGLQQTVDYLANILKNLGCEIIIHTDEEYGPTMVARKKGKGKLHVLMFAHMDTVWPVGSCERRKFLIKGNYAFGPGISDCSHGIIGQIFALKTLIEMGYEEYGELILLFNPDEEKCSPSSTKWIQKYAQEADLAFCMEGADKENLFISRRAGSVYYEMRVKGVLSHAGVDPLSGRNALNELVHKLNALDQLKIPDAYFSISFINGGNGCCIVSNNAYAMFRFRVDNSNAEKKVRESVEKIAALTYIDGTETELIDPHLGFPALEKTKESARICELIETTSKEMGYPLYESFCGGGADAPTCANMGIPTVDGMTPVSYRCHNEEEYLDLDTIVPRTAIMATILMRLSEDPSFLRLK